MMERERRVFLSAFAARTSWRPIVIHLQIKPLESSY